LETCCCWRAHAIERQEQSIEVQQGNTVADNTADLDNTREPDKSLVLDLIVTEQLGVVAEIPQEPTQFPKCFRCAIDPASDRPRREFLWLLNREADEVIRFACFPEVLCALDAHQEYPIWNFVRSRVPGIAQSLKAALHAAPSFWPI
jgi:hypothetical protein